MGGPHCHIRRGRRTVRRMSRPHTHRHSQGTHAHTVTAAHVYTYSCLHKPVLNAFPHILSTRTPVDNDMYATGTYMYKICIHANTHIWLDPPLSLQPPF